MHLMVQLNLKIVVVDLIELGLELKVMVSQYHLKRQLIVVVKVILKK